MHDIGRHSALGARLRNKVNRRYSSHSRNNGSQSCCLLLCSTRTAARKSVVRCIPFRQFPLGIARLGFRTAGTKWTRQLVTQKRLLWITGQTLLRNARIVPLVLVHPEDVGGHTTANPTSLRTPRDFRELEGLHEARRGATYPCRLVLADIHRPQAS